MWKKFKEFFATKYRIVAVYQDNTKCGFTVQKKCFLSNWVTAQVPKLEKVKSEGEVLIECDSFFKTKDEATNFIESQKTIV